MSNISKLTKIIEAIDDLKQLKELLDSDIISKDEFDNKKAKLLEKL